MLDGRHAQIVDVPAGPMDGQRWALARWEHADFPEHPEPFRSLTTYIAYDHTDGTAEHWERSDDLGAPLEAVLEHGSSPHDLTQVWPIPATGLVLHVVAPHARVRLRRRAETLGPLRVRSSMAPGRPLCCARSIHVPPSPASVPLPPYALSVLATSAPLVWLTPSGRSLHAGSRAIPPTAVAVRTLCRNAFATFETLS